MPAEPFCRSPREAAVLRKETASSCLSLEGDIDQFHLEEQGEHVVQVSDSEDELDRFLGVRTFGLVIARIDISSEEEDEEMALNRKKGLREFLADRAKEPVPNDTPRSQPLPSLPSPPPSFFYS